MEAFCAKHIDLAKVKNYKNYFEEHKANLNSNGNW